MDAIKDFVALAPVIEGNQVLQDMQMEGVQSYVEAEAVAVGLSVLRIEKALVFNRSQHAQASNTEAATDSASLPPPPPENDGALLPQDATEKSDATLPATQYQLLPHVVKGEVNSDVLVAPPPAPIEEGGNVNAQSDELAPKVKDIAARIAQTMMEGDLTSKQSQLEEKRNQVGTISIPYPQHSQPIMLGLWHVLV